MVSGNQVKPAIQRVKLRRRNFGHTLEVKGRPFTMCDTAVLCLWFGCSFFLLVRNGGVEFLEFFIVKGLGTAVHAEPAVVGDGGGVGVVWMGGLMDYWFGGWGRRGYRFRGWFDWV